MVKQRIPLSKVLTTKDIIAVWEVNELPMRHMYISKISERLYALLDQGVPVSRIKLAIEQYADSAWHRENNRFVNLQKFLSMEYINKWGTAKGENEFGRTLENVLIRMKNALESA